MVTRKSCCVCQKAGDEVTYHRFPANPSLKKIWVSRVPLKNWQWKSSSRLCSNHFLPSDYKDQSSDSNKRREKPCIKKKLLRTFGRHRAYATIFFFLKYVQGVKKRRQKMEKKMGVPDLVRPSRTHENLPFHEDVRFFSTAHLSC